MAESKNKRFCSVPRCSNSKQKQPYLSFHGFPTDGEQKKKWVRAIRRDEGVNFVIRRGSTFVCNRHFTAADYIEGTSRLKPGAVPTRFQWNNFHVPPHKPSAFETASSRRGVDVRPPETEVVETFCAQDHDYAARPPAGRPSGLNDIESVDWAPTVNLGYQKGSPTSEALCVGVARATSRNDQQRRTEAGGALLDLCESAENPKPEDLAKMPHDQRDVGCQTDLTMDDIERMEDVLRQTTAELDDLRTIALDRQFSQESFQRNEDKSKFYTGLPNF